MKIRSGLIFLISLSLVSFHSLAELNSPTTFGVVEPRIIMHGDSGSYNIRNTDKHKSWLVQSWVEDYVSGKKTNSVLALPSVFRVNANSAFTVKLNKKSELQSDRESVFWVISHSIPQQTKEQPDNKLNLAYQFRNILIYRPLALKGKKFSPDKIKLSTSPDGNATLFNDSPFAVTIVKITQNGKVFNFGNDKKVVLPFEKKKISGSLKQNQEVALYYKNDLGAVNVYKTKI